MNFILIKSITIPQGNVVKIIDQSGKILWQKNK